MNKKKLNIDRGKLLKTIVDENGISVTKLVKRVGYKDRASFYAHISKPDLSFDILSNYAKVLNYDLRQDFPDIASFLVEESSENFYSVPQTLEDAVELLNKWKAKYSQLMEKHLRLMEEMRTINNNG